MNDVWTERLKVILQIVTVLVAAVAAYFGNSAVNRATAIHEQQKVNTQKIDDTKVAAEETKKTVEVTAQKVGALK